MSVPEDNYDDSSLNKNEVQTVNEFINDGSVGNNSHKQMMLNAVMESKIFSKVESLYPKQVEEILGNSYIPIVRGYKYLYHLW
jgi:hypothetical protein